jgi:hypothetical protein
MRRWLLTCLLLVGCVTDQVDVSTSFDPLIPFPARATYRWDEASNKLPDDQRLNAMETDSVIRAAADAEFAERGYQVTATGSAHYKLSYDLAIHTWYAANNTSSQGSLSLWLVDAASNRRVWMGYVRAEIYVGLNREERVARLRKAMARLLEKFPPSQRPA